MADRLEPSDITDVVVEHKKAIIECVRDERVRQPELTGTLMMRITLRTSGAVKSAVAVSEAHKGSPLEACMRSEILSWQFPRHRQAMPPFEFPFKL